MWPWLERIASACWDRVRRYALTRRDEEDGSGSGGDADDLLLWSRDLVRHAAGEFSFAVVQANDVLEDHSQVETGAAATFIGVYDGHGGAEASRFISNHLAAHLVRIIWKGTLYLANLGDSRAVVGCLTGSNKIVAEQLTRDHNASMEEVRQELRSLHPDDSQIVVLKNGVWRIKGIIQGIARRLVKAALKEAARKREMKYNDIKKLEKGVRRFFHDDITILGSTCSCLHFNFPNFDTTSVDDFSFSPGSGIANGSLQITLSTGNITNQSGRVCYTRETLRLWDSKKRTVASFRTEFVLNILPNQQQNETGEGLAFILTSNLSSPRGSSGQWLGIANEQTDGSPANRIVAVEFDTRKSYDEDLDSNHVGLDVNGIRSVVQYPLSNAWPIDLSRDLSEEIYVGFAGSTGEFTELNQIKSWKFITAGDFDSKAARQEWTGHR
uniref:protein-serine/threonine phosphatase n=1 Tax=Oryza nivara TaxID=4536 RepID=A0A0E0H557_ORYNI